MYHTSCHNCDILKFWCECLYLLLTEHFWTKLQKTKFVFPEYAESVIWKGARKAFVCLPKLFPWKVYAKRNIWKVGPYMPDLSVFMGIVVAEATFGKSNQFCDFSLFANKFESK